MGFAWASWAQEPFQSGRAWWFSVWWSLPWKFWVGWTAWCSQMLYSTSARWLFGSSWLTNFPSNGRIFVCFLSIPHPQDVLIDFIRFPSRAPWYCHVSKKYMLEHRSRCSLSLRTFLCLKKRKDPKGWSLRMWFKASWWSPRFSRFQWWWPRSMAGCRPLDRPTADSWGLLTNQRENKEYNGGAPSDVCWFIARMN